jgi:hypothetical protein
MGILAADLGVPALDRIHEEPAASHEDYCTIRRRASG